MKLYFMRHGKAERHAQSDADRALTDRGRRNVASVIGNRRKALQTLDLVISSPYLRARQTAQIAMRELGYRGELLLCADLEPGANLRDLFQLINRLEQEAILLTTHQPLIGEAVSTLLDDDAYSTIGTSWLVALECDAAVAGCANLSWIEEP